MMPPNITPATPLVCIGITICVITQRVSAGVMATKAARGASPLLYCLYDLWVVLPLLLLGRRCRLLRRLGRLDLALDPGLELGLAALALHLRRVAIVSASHEKSPAWPCVAVGRLLYHSAAFVRVHRERKIRTGSGRRS